VLKAHISFYQNLCSLRKKRKALKPLVVKNDHAEIYNKSIMWKFFFEKKYKFQELDFDPEQL
jgi:hypothetical protein